VTTARISDPKDRLFEHPAWKRSTKLLCGALFRSEVQGGDSSIMRQPSLLLLPAHGGQDAIGHEAVKRVAQKGTVSACGIEIQH
jgi:hypothetical protein